jgi:hypothetical protein
MYIDPPRSLAVQPVSIDQVQDFGMVGNWSSRQRFQQVKNLVAVVQVATG